jgi:hypothetical protein
MPINDAVWCAPYLFMLVKAVGWVALKAGISLKSRLVSGCK